MEACTPAPATTTPPCAVKASPSSISTLDGEACAAFSFSMVFVALRATASIARCACSSASIARSRRRSAAEVFCVPGGWMTDTRTSASPNRKYWILVMSTSCRIATPEDSLVCRFFRQARGDITPVPNDTGDIQWLGHPAMRGRRGLDGHLDHPAGYEELALRRSSPAYAGCS